MSRANAVSKGTFYRGPEFKNPSGGTPKKSSYKKKQFSFLASASFEAISNLHSTISDLKCQIASLNKENKTLKMVTSKQERAIMQMDKDNQDYPHLMKVMAEELRVLKVYYD
jgi:regulator of replication initiation timing